MTSSETPISTDVWGPKAWGFMHAISFRYPETDASLEERTAILHFLNSLKLLIPCAKCRAHYASYLDDPDTGIRGTCSAHLEHRESISRWMVELHNDVNQRLGKASRSYDDVAEEYSHGEVCPSPVTHTCSDAKVGASRPHPRAAGSAKIVPPPRPRLRYGADARSLLDVPSPSGAKLALVAVIAVVWSLLLVFGTALLMRCLADNNSRNDGRGVRASPESQKTVTELLEKMAPQVAESLSQLRQTS